MAIAIPIVMAAAGASTTAIFATTLVLAATGINSKIDNAASKVFGKGLVRAANIAGAIYMGASAMGSGSADGAASAGDGINGLDAGTEAANAGADAAAAGGTSAAPEVSGDMAGMAGQRAAVGSMDGLDQGVSQATQQAAQQAAQQATTQGALKAAATQGAGSATSTGSGFTDKIANMWNGAGDRTKGALIQVGGNLLAGAAQGYAQAKQIADQRAYEQQQNAIYRSGSGYDYTKYGPASPWRKGG
jgi:hypothetical protein